MRSILWAGIFVSFVGCGGPGSVDGKVHGQSIAINDSISAAVNVTAGTAQFHAAEIVMANASSLCKDVAGRVEHPNEKVVVMAVFDVNGTSFTTPTAAGTYAIYQQGTQPGAHAATLSVAVNDATCKSVEAQSATATSGTITLDHVSGNVFSGKYDVVLDSGDHITGDFDPEGCPAIQTIIDSGGESVCQ